MRNKIKFAFGGKKKGFTLIELPVVRKRAFTLIELLVVIAIIGILATVVILNVANARAKAQDAKVKTDIETVARAVDIHIASENSMSGLISGGMAFIKLDDSKVSQFKDDSGTILLAIAPIHPRSTGTYDPYTDYNYFSRPLSQSPVYVDLVIYGYDSSGSYQYTYKWNNRLGPLVKTKTAGF